MVNITRLIISYLRGGEAPPPFNIGGLREEGEVTDDLDDEGFPLAASKKPKK